MRVFVTGAQGFVGRCIRRLWPRRGLHVVGTDRETDVTDFEALRQAVASARPDAVVHLAALSSVVDSHQQALSVYRVNFVGSRTLLQAVAEAAPSARVVLVGSGQAYGTAPLGSPPVRETAPLRPDSPYARSKAAADLLGEAWTRRGLDVVRARPFNHTGPGQSDAFVAASFARQIAQMEAGQRAPRLRVGNLDAVRDFLDVADVVEAYRRLLDPRVPAAAYNIASGTGVSIRHLLDMLLSRAAVSAEVEVDTTRVRPADALVGCAERLQQATGWTPSVPLCETLAHLLDHWRAFIDAAP